MSAGPPAAAYGRQGSLTLDLAAAGMALPHRVGLAGLWLTLQALDEDPAAAPARAALQAAGGGWQRTPTRVILGWRAGFARFWMALLAAAFRCEPDGRLWLAAWGSPPAAAATVLGRQWVLLGSFWQHPRSRAADPARQPTGVVAEAMPGDRPPRRWTFPRVTWVAHQHVPVPAATAAPVRSWLWPGASVRHGGIDAHRTGWAEPPERFVPLVFLPAGVVPVSIVAFVPQTGWRHGYALVLPEVRDLAGHAALWRRWQADLPHDPLAAGPEEAAGRILVALRTAGQRAGVPAPLWPHQATAWVFESVAWSEQRVRTAVRTVTWPTNPATARLWMQIFGAEPDRFPAQAVTGSDGHGRWIVPQVPALLAANLTAGRPWWRGLADWMGRRDPAGTGEDPARKGMTSLIDTLADPERQFVHACQEAWRARAAQLGAQARQETRHRPFRRAVRFRQLYHAEWARWRGALLRCRTAAAFRTTLLALWTQPQGALPTLQAHWTACGPFLEARWQEGRDLALLALVSYRRPRAETPADPEARG